MSLLAGVAVFHIGAVVYIWGEDYQLTSEDYYEEEQTYSDMVQRLRRGSAYTCDLQLNTRSLRLAVRDVTDGRPELSDVIVKLYKPDDADADQELVLKRDENGVWFADLDGLRPGLWQYTVEATLGDEKLAWRARTSI